VEREKKLFFEVLLYSLQVLVCFLYFSLCDEAAGSFDVV
jgi:hypothetical protein